MLRSLPLVLLCLIASRGATGQDMSVRIRIDESKPAIAVVEGRFLKARGVPNLSFLNSYAGVTNLTFRLSDVKLADADKQPVEFKRLQAGEYLAERNYEWFAYTLDLKPLPNAASSAHVSWLTADEGILDLDDLLPQPTDKMRVRLTLDLPRGWRIVTNEDRVDENIIDIHDAQRAALIVGKNWRLKPVASPNMTLAISGVWQFTDEDAADDAATIYKAYLKNTGHAPAGTAPMLVLAKFPRAVSVGNWEAETRGSIVTILSSGGTSAMDGRLRLKQQLRHEIFHLWLPNGVDLKGNYDWFYEGFAVYEEQKLGVAINQIRFQDFLNTLARAYDIDRLSMHRSLIESSQNRWAGSNTQVYARGMLVAFVADVSLLEASQGKRSVETLLKQLFERHRPPAASTNANDAVMTLMKNYPELTPIVDRYIAGSVAVDWTAILENAGLQATTQDQLTTLSAVAKPSGRQRALLDKLGYNSWRKLLP